MPWRPLLGRSRRSAEGIGSPVVSSERALKYRKRRERLSRPSGLAAGWRAQFAVDGPDVGVSPSLGSLAR